MTVTAIEPGRYICVRTSGFVPWVIRWATHSPYDHTAVVIPGNRVVEAEPEGVRISPLSKYAGATVCANVGEPMTDRQRSLVVQAAMGMVDAPYNFATIGYQGLADLLGWHWALLLRLARGGHVFDCSQLAAVAGARADLDWMCGQTVPALVTPAALAGRPGVEPVKVS